MSATRFIQQLKTAWQRNASLLCVGLDPEPARFPDVLRDSDDPIFDFCRAIVDATADLVCCFKPQIAHFAAKGAEGSLLRLMQHLRAHHPQVPVILDAKRGDIGSTAEHYAAEAFERYGADAVTVNPYLGHDSLAPYLKRADKGVVILCRTSNPGARDLQDLDVGGRPLYQHVAATAAREWNANGNCLLVVGATYPDEMKQVRALVGEMPFLVPGIGAQGGDVAAVLANGKTADGTGLVISSSRAILYAGSGADFAEAARKAAEKQRNEINRYR